MNKSTPMIGKVFGRLTVMSVSGKDKDGHCFWNCVCICGGKKRTRGYSLRRGHVQSCGCLQKDRSVGLDRKYTTNEEAAWAYNYQQYQRNAKFRNLSVEITFEQFKEICSQNCFYCGEPPEKRPSQRGRGSVYASGVDRVDNSVGYTKENSVPCCTWCNRAKNNMAMDIFIKKCKTVAANAGWVGYIEKLRSTFTKSGLPGGVAEKNSFSSGLEVGHYCLVYVHSGAGCATY